MRVGIPEDLVASFMQHAKPGEAVKDVIERIAMEVDERGVATRKYRPLLQRLVACLPLDADGNKRAKTMWQALEKRR